MKQIIDTQKISGREYFKKAMKECGFTTENLTRTYNILHPEKPISIQLVQSLSSGRRSFAYTASQTVFRIAHILSGDPDCNESDFYRYANIAYHLINGCTLPIYENHKIQ